MSTSQKNVANSRANLPAVPDHPTSELVDSVQSIQDYEIRLSAALSRELDNRVSKRAPVSELLVVSPRGNVYGITVSDAGIISATLRYQP